MCGIAGVIECATDANGFPDPLERIVDRMSDCMIHRGPDAAGLWKSPSARVVLSHRRLAIIDLSEDGRQPMSYADGRYWITFNGEIYNFKGLGSELCALGHKFRSESDTEVLLAAIAQWGIANALTRIVGMFAFAVWDEREHVMHLARDRMGEKPLYLAEINGYLFFASELRAFLPIPGFEPRVSGTATAAYLRDGYIPGALSIYEGIYKLGPGQIATVRAGSGHRLSDTWLRGKDTRDWTELTPRSYWSCTQVAKSAQTSLITDEGGALELGEAILREAVRMQMHADVPTGAFLSGGIDSSLVVTLMQAQSARPVRTFTVAFDDPRYDESKYARSIASHLGTSHEQFLLRESEIFEQIPSLIHFMDEPTANGSFFPVHLISRLARTQVTVVLSGDGGDELFAGYNRYALARRAWKATRWIPRRFRSHAATFLAADGLLRGQYRLLAKLARLGSQVDSTDARRKLTGILRSRTFAEAYLSLTSCWSENSLLSADFQVPLRHWSDDFLDNVSCMLLADQVDYLPDDSLAKVDRASMAASLETRLPLLDHRFVEFSWRLPMDLKLRGRTSKWLLRAILNRYLPRSLTERPKMGFSVPTDKWLRGPLREWAADILRAKEFHNMFPVRQGAIRQLWDDYEAGHGPSAYGMWSLVMLSAWAQSVASDSSRSYGSANRHPTAPASSGGLRL